MILRSNTQKRHYLKGNKHRMRANLSTTTEAKIGGLIYIFNVLRENNNPEYLDKIFFKIRY